jgi:hypothetical protein
MDARGERIGKNEAVFRRVNERLKELGEGFSLVAEHSDFVCECGNEGCVEAVELSLDEYERVRANPAWFIVRPGHEAPGLEFVVERHGTYSIIEKHEGEPAELARDADPRS